MHTQRISQRIRLTSLFVAVGVVAVVAVMGGMMGPGGVGKEGNKAVMVGKEDATTTVPDTSTTTEEVTSTTVAEEVVEGVAVSPPPSAPTAPVPAPVSSAVTYGSGACGGNLPPCYVMERESGGDPTVYNYAGSGASGKWQIMPGTWNGYDGYRNAADAPESVQDEFAAALWDGGRGCAAWSAC